MFLFKVDINAQAGDCLFQKTFHIDPISLKKVPNKGQLPQYYLEDCVPAIVSKVSC